MATPNVGLTRRILIFLGIGFGVLVVIGALVGVAYSLSTGHIETAVGLPVLAVSAVITLLGVLSLVSIAFAMFGIDDKTQALGLPDGSIRAVIALSLIVLFGVFCVYLYGGLSAEHVASVKGLNAAAAQAFEQSLPSGALISNTPSPNNSHDIYFYMTPSQASSDFAKQILTLVGTLVTAIASFYFGSNAVASAVAQSGSAGSPTEPPTPKPTSVTPSSGHPGDTLTLTIAGSALGAVSAVSLNGAGAAIQLSTVRAADSSVTASVNIPPNATPGQYDVVCSVGPTVYALPSAFTVSTGVLPGSNVADDNEAPVLSRTRGGVSPSRGVGALKSEAIAPPPQAQAGPSGVLASNFTWHGGPVLSAPKVWVSFWGDLWRTDAAHVQRANDLYRFQQDLMASGFMNVLTQYGVGRGRVAGRFFVGGLTGQLAGGAVESTLRNAVQTGQMSTPDSQTCVIVFLQDGSSVLDGELQLCGASNDNAFGFHSFCQTLAGDVVYFAIIPSLDDSCLRASCSNDASCSLHLGQDRLARLTQVTSHEFAEMVTDPELNAWYSGDTAHENGDLCNGESDTIIVGGRTWTVQKTYNKSGDTGKPDANPALAKADTPIPPLVNGPLKT